MGVATLDGTTAVVIGILGIIFAPLLTYLVAAKKLSGKIETSEAADLWEEASKLRQEYKDEVQRLNTELAAQRTKAVEEAEACKSEIATLRKRVENCEAIMAENLELRHEIAELKQKGMT